MSVGFCLGIALVYIYISPKSYKRTALVMIRDDSKKSDITSTLGDKFVVSMSSNVKNEVEAFRSPKLIRDVVVRLNMTTQYKVVRKMKEEYLYNQTPIAALFPDASEDDAFYFQVEIKSNNEVVLSKFKNRGKRIDGYAQGKLNDTIHTPIGKVLLSPTLHFENHQNAVTLAVEKTAIQSTAGAFAKNMSASLVSKDNSIIQLEVISYNISRAEDFLNELIAMYNENWMKEKNIFAENTLKFYNEQLPLVKMELDEFDKQLEQYKSRNPLTNVQSSATILMNQSSDYTGKIIEVNTQLNIAQYLREYLNKNDNITSLLPSGLNNAAIESQIEQYNTLLRERDGLIANSSERNTAVAERNNRLQSMRQSIAQAIDNQIVTLNTKLMALQSQEERMTRQIASNPVQERQLAIIERERKIKEELYLFMLQKKEDNEMALVTETINTRIISPPAGLDTPVKPQKKLVCLIALFVGVVIPGSIIWGKEGFNVKIRGKGDLDELSVPLLGVISLADNVYLKNGVSCIVTETGRDMVNETFRMVRTSMNSTCGKDMKVVMFTSFEPGCGKTFVSLNLAMTFALAGKRIALVDVDMRTATLSKVID